MSKQTMTVINRVINSDNEIVDIVWARNVTDKWDAMRAVMGLLDLNTDSDSAIPDKYAPKPVDIHIQFNDVN